jgi:hypothetical protein
MNSKLINNNGSIAERLPSPMAIGGRKQLEPLK